MEEDGTEQWGAEIGLCRVMEAFWILLAEGSLPQEKAFHVIYTLLCS